MTPRWPRALPPKSLALALDMPSTSGGPAIGGYEQVAQSPAGRWAATVSFHISRAPARGGDGVLFFRWFLSYMQGRANPILLPVFDRANTPAAVAGIWPAFLPHSDGSPFSDGSEYAPELSPAQISGAWPCGAIQIAILYLGIGILQPGHLFSVCDRLYAISSAVATATPNIWTVGIWPPLRVAIADGQWAEFDDPVCLMRLAKDDTAALSLQPGYQGDVSIDLIEAPVS